MKALALTALLLALLPSAAEAGPLSRLRSRVRSNGAAPAAAPAVTPQACHDCPVEHAAPHVTPAPSAKPYAVSPAPQAAPAAPAASKAPVQTPEERAAMWVKVDRDFRAYMAKEYPELPAAKPGMHWQPHYDIWIGKHFRDYPNFWEGAEWNRAAPAAPAPRAATGYPLRSSHWSHPGEIHEHLLRAHPEFDAAYVGTLSDREAEALHSDAHEGRVNWQYAKRAAAVAKAPVRSSCPGGVCPANGSRAPVRRFGVFGWR